MGYFYEEKWLDLIIVKNNTLLSDEWYNKLVNEVLIC